MEITLNEKDREYIAEQCAAKLHDKIMLALLSGAGYEHMADKVKRWVNFHTDEAMVKSVIRDEINAAVKKEISAMFSEYASRETKAVVAPIREAIHAQAVAAVAEILETLNYVRPSDEEN